MRNLLFMLMLALTGSLVRAEVPAQLLDHVPAGANALAVIDAAHLFGSPLAQRESWATAYADAYGSTALLMPPDATSMVLGADLDFEFLKPRWEVAVLEVVKPRTVESIARQTQGVVDQIAERPAVETPFGAYVVQLAPLRFGVFAPANRQAIARWLEQTSKSSTVSPYLRAMTQQAQEKRASIGLAIDLRNTISARTASGELALSDVLREHNIWTDRAAQAMVGVQGLKLLVTARDQLEGSLTIDFSEDISFLGSAAGPLVMTAFRRLGASMDQWTDWQTTVRGSVLTMTGQLGARDLRNVLSVFRLSRSEPTNLAARQMAEPEPARAEGSRANADLTRRYFGSIVSYVTELQQSMTGASPYQFAWWLDHGASRIDGLPQGLVDPQVVEYGQSVSRQLRALLATLNNLDQQSLS